MQFISRNPPSSLHDLDRSHFYCLDELRRPLQGGISSRSHLPWLARGLEASIPQSSYPLCTCKGRSPADVVQPASHEAHCGIVVTPLETSNIRDQLIMHSRLPQGLCSGHVMIKDMPQRLQCCGNDTRTACTANHIIETIIRGVFHDCWSYRRHWPFARAYIICRRWEIAKLVPFFWNREICFT